MVTQPAANGSQPVPLYPDESDLAERLQETFAARRAVATAARIRDLEALMAEQSRAAALERDLADITHQRDLALDRNAAIEADRDRWRVLCEWQESALAGRQRYIAHLSARYQRLRAARRRDAGHALALILSTALVGIVTIAVLLAGPIATSLGVFLP